jgi:hypothetical protein
MTQDGEDERRRQLFLDALKKRDESARPAADEDERRRQLFLSALEKRDAAEREPTEEESRLPELLIGKTGLKALELAKDAGGGVLRGAKDVGGAALRMALSERAIGKTGQQTLDLLGKIGRVSQEGLISGAQSVFSPVPPGGVVTGSPAHKVQLAHAEFERTQGRKPTLLESSDISAQANPLPIGVRPLAGIVADPLNIAFLGAGPAIRGARLALGIPTTTKAALKPFRVKPVQPEAIPAARVADVPPTTTARAADVPAPAAARTALTPDEATELARLKGQLANNEAALEDLLNDPEAIRRGLKPRPYTVRYPGRQPGSEGYRPPLARTAAQRAEDIVAAEDAVKVAKEEVADAERGIKDGLLEPDDLTEAKSALSNARSELREAKKPTVYTAEEKAYIAAADKLDVEVPRSLRASIQRAQKEIAELESRQAAPITPATAREVAEEALPVGTRGFRVEGGGIQLESGIKSWSIKNDGSGASMRLGDDGVGVIGRLKTPEPLRRQGFAEALMRDGIQLLSDNGATTIRVHSSSAGRPVFKKLGFKETGFKTRSVTEQVLDRRGIENLLGPTTPAARVAAGEARQVVPAVQDAIPLQGRTDLRALAAPADVGPLPPAPIRGQPVSPSISSTSGPIPLSEPLGRMVARKALPQPSTPTAPSTPAGMMAPDDANSIVEWFGKAIASPESIQATEVTGIIRQRELARRFVSFESRARTLVEGGMPVEQAMQEARKELAGELPRVATGLESVVSEEVRSALFSRVYTALATDVPEQLATATALTNALLGKPIPRTPGIAGGSAFSRLSRVFPADVVAALNKQQSLDTLLLSKFAAPRGVTRIRQPANVPFGQARLGEGAFTLRDIPADLRTAAQRELDLSDFRAQVEGRQAGIGERIAIPDEGALGGVQQGRLFDEPFQRRHLPVDPRTAATRQLDLDTFRVLMADEPVNPLTGRAAALQAVREPLDEIAVNQLRLIPPTTRERLLAAARTIWAQPVDAANLLRSHVASVDLSYLRQQALLIPGNPVKFSQSFYDAVRALWSQEYANRVMTSIRRDPLFIKYQRVNVDFLRPLVDDPVSAQWQAAEDFMILSNVSGKTMPRPFQALAQKLPWLRISARAHITGTNSMNWRIFKGYHKELMRMEEEIAAGRVALKEGDAFLPEQSLKKAGQLLADMSGRGPVGPLKEMSPALNGLFFSLRLNLGRLLAPRHLFSSDGFTRRKAWKNFMSAIGVYGSFVLAGREMGLWDVETDPRSSDFMKIVLAGRTRVDVWGGMQQFVVLYGRLLSVFATGQVEAKSTTSGQTFDIGPDELVMRMMRTKASPAAQNVLELWSKEDFKGAEIDRTDAKRWLARNSMISVQDAFESFAAHGLGGLPLTVLSGLGEGVNTYALPRWPELDEYYGYSEGRTSREADGLRKRFRMNPDNEAKLFVRGQITTLLTGNLGRRRVLELMRELKVDPADVPGYVKEFRRTDLPVAVGQ